MALRKITLAFTLLSAGFISSASATVIDFNSAGGSPDPYTEQGVTFTNISATGSSFSNAPNSTQAILMSGEALGVFRADITGGASFVSVDLGDYNADADRIFLSIFDSLDNLLNTVSLDLANSFVGMETLSLAAASIAYATFGTTGEIGLGGIFADNFTFESASVPEPAALGLLGFGVVAFGLRRRKTAS